MADHNDHPERFHELNWFGRAVYLGGTAVRLTANLIDHTLERAADVVADSERAFKQGRDPNVEEAKIIEEREER